MNRVLNNFVRSRFPAVHQWLKRALQEYPRLAHSIGTSLNWRIASGPFAGMQYMNEAYGSRLIPKLLGSYEQELHPWLTRIIRKQFDTIVDVGCAEGYYAIGLALVMPDTRVIAFDRDPEAQACCRRLAELNGVSDRVEVRGECTVSAMEEFPLGGTLVVCDCEGYEAELLDPAKLPGLRASTLLVELHDCFVAGVTQSLKERFVKTHEIEIVAEQDRKPEQYPCLHKRSKKMQRLAVDEDRTVNGVRVGQQWGLFWPRG
jgi:hypothetical protein